MADTRGKDTDGQGQGQSPPACWAHRGGRDPGDLLDLAAWARGTAGLDWRAALAEPQDERIISSSRLVTSRGPPFGSDSFLSKVVKHLGRRLRPLPVGRSKTKKPKPGRSPRRRATE